jgi:hypothetical protein
MYARADMRASEYDRQPGGQAKDRERAELQWIERAVFANFLRRRAVGRSKKKMMEARLRLERV